MATPTAQTYANHTRLHPLFHLVIAPILILTVILGIVEAVRQPTLHNIWMVVFFIAVFLLSFLTRTYALKVQDRVIRLEERLRLTELVAAPIRPQVVRLSEGQLIALRFASDEEAPTLVERALTENMAPADIKKAIRNWRADHWRI
ncbi:MAG: DUF6526 family protein [Bryobacteraceae bacterium]